MAKQSKNKVKLNKEYVQLGTFSKSQLAAIRKHYKIPEDAKRIWGMPTHPRSRLLDLPVSHATPICARSERLGTRLFLPQKYKTF